MKLHQGSSGTSSAAADVLLCPGVKVLSPRKLTKEQLSGKDDEVMGNGFGANVQLLDTDIDHLQEIFPGMSQAFWFCGKLGLWLLPRSSGHPCASISHSLFRFCR